MHAARDFEPTRSNFLLETAGFDFTIATIIDLHGGKQWQFRGRNRRCSARKSDKFAAFFTQGWRRFRAAKQPACVGAAMTARVRSGYPANACR